MTDRDVLGFVLSGLVGALGFFIWISGEKFLAVAVGAILASHLIDWWEEPDPGEKRPVLTVLTEIAGIVGCVIAFAEFITR